MNGEHVDETVDVNEIYQQMDDLGRAKFDAALAQVQLRRMSKRIAELENAQTGEVPAGSGRVVEG